MDYGKVIPWGFIISGLRCAESVFVTDVVSGGDGFDDDGMVCVDELLLLCTMNILEEVVCVGVAHLVL